MPIKTAALESMFQPLQSSPLMEWADQSPLMNKNKSIDTFVRSTHTELILKLIGACTHHPTEPYKNVPPSVCYKLKS